MIAEMSLRLKAALEPGAVVDSLSPFRLYRRASADDPAQHVTESDIHELESIARALRKQLNHLVDDELTSSTEACALATDGLELLRNDLEAKRCQRDELRKLLDETKSELALVERQYLEEKELREMNNNDVVRMKGNTEQLRIDAINLRTEIKQMIYCQKTLDAETKHRLRADVQNLELEKERETIKLRQLNSARDKLRFDLDKVQLEKEEAQRIKFQRHQSLAEAKMTCDMYNVRRQELQLHLQDLDAHARSLFNSRVSSVMQSCLGLIKGGRAEEFLRESNHIKDTSSRATPNFITPCQDNWEQRYDRVNLRRRSKSPFPHHHQQLVVGQVVVCADDGAESSEFVAQAIPPGKFDDPPPEKENQNSLEKGVEIPSDSDSMSVISALTMDDDAWAKYRAVK